MLSCRQASSEEFWEFPTTSSSTTDEIPGLRESCVNSDRVASACPNGSVRSRKEPLDWPEQVAKAISWRQSRTCSVPSHWPRKCSVRNTTPGSENAPPIYDGHSDQGVDSGTAVSGLRWASASIPRSNSDSRDFSNSRTSSPSLFDQATHRLEAENHSDTASNLLAPPRPPCLAQTASYRNEDITSRILSISAINDSKIPHTSSDKISKTRPCFLPRPRIGRRLRPSQREDKVKPLSKDKIRALDRFISPRVPREASRCALLLSKSPANLSVQERHNRQTIYDLDVFGLSIRARARARLAHSVQVSSTATRNRFSSSWHRRVLGLRSVPLGNANHQAGSGAVLTVAGTLAVLNPSNPIQNGRGGLIGSGTNAPIYASDFVEALTSYMDLELFEDRLAMAFDIDRASRVLHSPSYETCSGHMRHGPVHAKPVWKDNTWVQESCRPLLEAPNLRDDFYCSVLAYSRKADCLAVALADKVYLWSESQGVRNPPSELQPAPSRGDHVTSLAFSSLQGDRAILAVGRGNGHVVLWSPSDIESRFISVPYRSHSAHLAFRPVVTRCPSHRHPTIMVDNEVLLVGDDTGQVIVYLVEWPNDRDRFTFGWHGAIALQATLQLHAQQVCGISWSADGDYFATGGNDNLCCLFEWIKVVASMNRNARPTITIRHDVFGHNYLEITPSSTGEVAILPASVKHQWRLNAAIKAIAFCPWQHGLVAVGGGSNDRCIHFYHTMSGACLATIDCAAQVTSLIWSTTRREIAATFGFAQPEHPYRIAVYAWPSCRQVVAIPWQDDMRALCAIPYPNGPSPGPSKREGRAWCSRTVEEGCIVVAASDGSIKFHEIWCETKRATWPHQGSLGGSDILEGLHGIDKDGTEVIR